MGKEVKPVTTVEVTLAGPHTHAGKDYKAGEKITVRESQVKWLAEAGTIRDNKPGGKPAEKKEE